MHEDEIEIDESLVRALVESALPDLAARTLTPLDVSGSSNLLFRLGDDLLVRLPRQPGGAATIAKEARWLPYLAPGLPVSVPQIVAVCEPAHGYPERWSVVRWIDGTTPAVPGTDEPSALANDLAAVVAALRELPVPPAALEDASLRWYRADPLAEMAGDIRGYLDDCRELSDLDLDLEACARIWDEAMELPDASVEPRWLHGDLLAENLLVRDGRLAAVLDFGGLAVGDPTVDLVVAWEALNPTQRAVFRSVLEVDEVTWLRGRAWALAIATMTFPYYWRTMPGRCASRLAMAQAVLRDAES